MRIIEIIWCHCTFDECVLMQGQQLDLVATSELASKVTLPSISKDVIDALNTPRTVVSSVARGFLPNLDASAKPPANGISLTLNVTEVSY